MLLASRMIANPLRQLRSEFERIRQFHLEGGVDVRMHLIEVDDLARATAAMKSTLRSFTRDVPRDLVRELRTDPPGSDWTGVETFATK